MNTLEFIDTVGSTNAYLEEKFPDNIPDSGYAIATFNQTDGRGQRGNLWLVEPDTNICYSYIFKPDSIVAHDQFIISQAVSLAVKSMLDKYSSDITIKWPNDIMWKDKKIAGILIENNIKGKNINYSIVGIGININQGCFSQDLPYAVSLSQITGKKYDLKKLTEELNDSIFLALSNLGSDNFETIQRYYLNNLYRRDGLHRYKDHEGVFFARIRGIEPAGNLILEMEDQSVKAYAFKEVVFDL
jgi:BirA family biotin operon repressor/biotin-[acetyl-CoA-carboxylase] ligase